VAVTSEEEKKIDGPIIALLKQVMFSFEKG
jgi:hypothetical protein